MDTPATADPQIPPQPSHTPDSHKRPVVQSWLAVLLILTVVVSTLVNAGLILSIARQERDREIAAETAKQLTDARSRLSTVQSELEALRRQKDALAPLVADWDKRAAERAASEAAISALEEKRPRLETEVNSLTARRDLLDRQMTELNSNRTELQGVVDNLRTETNALSRQKQELQTTVTQALDAERRRSEADASRSAAEVRSKSLQAEIVADQRRLDQTRSDADAQRKALDSLVKEVADLREKREALNTDIARFQAQDADLHARRNSLQELEEDLSKRQQEAADAGARAEGAEKRFRKASADIAEVQKGLEAVQNEASKWEARRDKARVDFQDADAELAAARKLERESSVRRDQPDSELRDLRTQVVTLLKQKADLENEIRSLEAQRPKQPPVAP